MKRRGQVILRGDSWSYRIFVGRVQGKRSYLSRAVNSRAEAVQAIYNHYLDRNVIINETREVDTEGEVYAIQCTITKLIKIGFSSSVARRLAALGTMSPTPLRLLGAIAGSRSVELILHTQLAANRQHGEWFKITEDEAIQALGALAAKLGVGGIYVKEPKW